MVVVVVVVVVRVGSCAHTPDKRARRLENRGVKSGRGALDMSGSCKEALPLKRNAEQSCGTLRVER